MTDFLDLTRSVSGPDRTPPAEGSSLRGGEPERKSAADVIATVVVGVAFGLCAVIWFVLFCVIAWIA